MDKILALDLGKFKSTACVYDIPAGTHEFRTIPTTPQAVHDLLAELIPGVGRLVIEMGPSAGWVKDLGESMELAVQVANVNHESWKWSGVKRKTDRDDALKLARMSVLGQLPTVHVPDRKVRQWRGLITYRHALVGRRTAIKNSIRAILVSQGLSMESGRKGWTERSRRELETLAMALPAAGEAELWRGQLKLELLALDQVQGLIDPVEEKLESIAQTDERVALLRTIPGVGPRLAEVVSAVIDDPHRFDSGKQIGSYAGLAPRVMESGTLRRTLGISGRGNKLLRGLLVEVSWLMRRYNGYLRKTFDRVSRGLKSRRKIAVVATARKLLTICWAMLRDGTKWKEPATAKA